MISIDYGHKRGVRMPIKKNIHKLYLLVSAGLIIYGILMGITGRGQIHLLLDMADNAPPHLQALKTFTYQSNILLAVGFMVMLVLYKSKARHYISASIILATGLTGLVYNFMLVPFAQAPLPFITSRISQPMCLRWCCPC